MSQILNIIYNVLCLHWQLLCFVCYPVSSLTICSMPLYIFETLVESNMNWRLYFHGTRELYKYHAVMMSSLSCTFSMMLYWHADIDVFIMFTVSVISNSFLFYWRNKLITCIIISVIVIMRPLPMKPEGDYILWWAMIKMQDSFKMDS